MRRDPAFLLDMLNAARQARTVCQSHTADSFAADTLLPLAVMRLITIIGEAANRVTPEFCAQHPEIPRRDIAGMRHRLVHDYFRVDLAKVWDVVVNHLPGLIELLHPLVPSEEADPDGSTGS